MFGEVDVLIDNIYCDNLIDISFYLQLNCFIFHGDVIYWFMLSLNILYNQLSLLWCG
jgi:hypothetical protein